MNKLFVLMLSVVVTACGSGGDGIPTPELSQAAKDAIKNVAAQYPAPTPFTGAFVLVEGASMGYLSNTSPEAIVRSIADAVVANPVKFPEYYKLMLSSTGLRVTIIGESLGIGPLGLPQKKPDVVYTAKLTPQGVVITY